MNAPISRPNPPAPRTEPGMWELAGRDQLGQDQWVWKPWGPNPIDVVSLHDAAHDRDVLLTAKFPRLLRQLDRPGKSADRAAAHSALAAMYEELAVMASIVYVHPEPRRGVLDDNNAMVRLLRATAEAETARARGRRRRPSGWTQLEETVGAILHSITATAEHDHATLANLYDNLSIQLDVAKLGPASAIVDLHRIRDGHAAAATPPPAEEPGEGGEYSCSHCGTSGWDCLTEMNASPDDRRCCGACGINTTHARPAAAAPAPRDALALTLADAVPGATHADLLAAADAAIAQVEKLGWRPPLTATDVDSLRSVVAGRIDGHFGDDYREASLAAAQELIDAGYFDRTGAFGPFAPVASTLRRVIGDLEYRALTLDPVASDTTSAENAAGARALLAYAERIRQHPALAGAAPDGTDGGAR